MALASRRRRRGERAQSIIEFALTAPILVFLVLAMMEVGNGLNSYLTVIAAARDAARMGAQGEATQASLRNLVDKETNRLPDDLPTGVNCPAGEGVCVQGASDQTTLTIDGKKAVRVTVCYDHPMIIGSPVFLGPIQMCSKTTMRVTSG